ncbi:MAG: hypothetical protein K8T89_14450 [Planctomycetes bacterium]|nr:hypothetical protein [Planctomycetota bacterium]
MSEGNGAPRRYSVSMSQFQKSRLRHLHQQAEDSGRGQRFLIAYREIVRRLQRDPRVFGEALYTLTTLRLEIRQAAIHPIVVDYGVDEDQKVVFIKGFKILD